MFPFIFVCSALIGPPPLMVFKIRAWRPYDVLCHLFLRKVKEVVLLGSDVQCRAQRSAWIEACKDPRLWTERKNADWGQSARVVAGSSRRA
jgi:hypothetical protein